ncbi:15221_t:CDS:2, partial [Funneliformis geosporum]
MGREFSLCERAGSKIENNRKILDKALKVQKTLKDMHKTLTDTIVMTSDGAISKEVLDVIPKMLMPGFLSSRFFIRLILIIYVGAGFYLSAELAEFDIPTAYEELMGVLKMARIMLQAKERMLSSTVALFASTKERAEREKFLPGKVLLPDRPKEFSSPTKSKTESCIYYICISAHIGFILHALMITAKSTFAENNLPICPEVATEKIRLADRKSTRDLSCEEVAGS